MHSSDHLNVLKKTGIVLIAVGFLDIGLMIYSTLTRTSYSSSLNVFAVIAGIFLVRGSLGAAALVRWFALFFASALLSMILVWPLVQPMGLTVTQAQLDPAAFGVATIFFAFALALFVWLARELSSEPVLEAQRQTGKRQAGWRSLLPIGTGLALACLLAIVSFLVQHSDSGTRAVREVRAKLGDGYKYHVASLNFHSSAGETRVSGVVTAWKIGAIHNVAFGWRD